MKKEKEIKTVGELKKFLQKYPDDMPVTRNWFLNEDSLRPSPAIFVEETEEIYFPGDWKESEMGKRPESNILVF